MGLLQDIGEHTSSSAAALSLAALAFLGGCSQTVTTETLQNSGPAAVVGNTLKELSGPGIDRTRERISLSDTDINRIQLLPQAAYVIEVPTGSFAEIKGAIAAPRNMWSFAGVTDESLVFTVPAHPENYAIRVHAYEYCSRQDRPEDGTYVELLDLTKDLEIVSAIKLDSLDSFKAGTGEKNLLAYIRSAETGEIFQVPTPYFDRSTNSHQVPSAIRYIQGEITPIQNAAKLPVAE